MHTLSCFYLLHQDFEAFDTPYDYISLSSNSINDESMSEFSDDTHHSSLDQWVDEPNPNETDLAADENPELPTGSTINPDDEEHQFVYDAGAQVLLCTGSTFNEVPQVIIDKYATTTKVIPSNTDRAIVIHDHRSFRFWT